MVLQHIMEVDWTVMISKTSFMNNLVSDRGGGVFIDQYEQSITNIIQWYVYFEEYLFIGN